MATSQAIESPSIEKPVCRKNNLKRSNTNIFYLFERKCTKNQGEPPCIYHYLCSKNERNNLT